MGGSAWVSPMGGPPLIGPVTAARANRCAFPYLELASMAASTRSVRTLPLVACDSLPQGPRSRHVLGAPPRTVSSRAPPAVRCGEPLARAGSTENEIRRPPGRLLSSRAPARLLPDGEMHDGHL